MGACEGLLQAGKTTPQVPSSHHACASSPGCPGTSSHSRGARLRPWAAAASSHLPAESCGAEPGAGDTLPGWSGCRAPNLPCPQQSSGRPPAWRSRHCPPDFQVFSCLGALEAQDGSRAELAGPGCLVPTDLGKAGVMPVLPHQMAVPRVASAQSVPDKGSDTWRRAHENQGPWPSVCKAVCAGSTGEKEETRR